MGGIISNASKIDAGHTTKLSLHNQSQLGMLASAKSRCRLLQLIPPEIFDYIFVYLLLTDLSGAPVNRRCGIGSIGQVCRTSDLLAFMMSCSDAYRLVVSFIVRFLRHLEFDVADIENFRNNQPMLLNELLLTKQLRRLQSLRRDYIASTLHTNRTGCLDSSTDVSSLNHLRAALAFHNIHRASVYESEIFPHLNDERFIVKRTSESLFRDTVYLRNVCWLNFAKAFRLRSAGEYVASLRLRMDRHRFLWPENPQLPLGQIANIDLGHGLQTTVGVYSVAPDCDVLTCNSPQYVDQPLTKCEIRGSQWHDMCARRSLTTPLSGCKIITDGNVSFDWITLVIDPFVVDEPNKLVVFDFRDITGLWKSGMEWDFIQVAKL